MSLVKQQLISLLQIYLFKDVCGIIYNYVIDVIDLTKDYAIDSIIKFNHYKPNHIFRPIFPQSIELFEQFNLDNFPNNIYPSLDKAELYFYQQGYNSSHENPWVIIGQLNSNIYFSLY